MLRTQSRVAVVLVAAGIVLAIRPVEGCDVKVDLDKEFDFKSARTWGWNPEGRGDVKMARTQEDDPDAMRKWVEPVMADAVMNEMKGRGMQAAAASPDLFVTYYLLL